MKRKRMKIEYDVDAMSSKVQCKMESELWIVLRRYGWKVWASGADVAKTNGPRMRDIALEYYPRKRQTK